MSIDNVAQELVGVTIKEVFNHAEAIADLHACLSSPRGDHFRLRLLQALEIPMDDEGVGRIKEESGVQEYHRHLHKLLNLGMVQSDEADGVQHYVRTHLGEQAINAVRELERSVNQPAARAIDTAALGANSIRFFLRIYGDRAEVNWERGEVQYTPGELGRLSLFLPRAIEGVSAADKLSEAGLLIYRDDGKIYVPPIKARAFYRYLRQLYGIIKANAGRSGNWRQSD